MNRFAAAVLLLCLTSAAQAQTPALPYTHPITVTLLPYQSYRVDGVGGNPQVNSAWNAIASAGGSSLTVFEWE